MTDQWDTETDVVIVGSGFAGLSAAIEARRAGASVIILEKMKGYGGNSVISDGIMAAAGTPQQEKAGIKDSPVLMYEDMLKAGLGLNHPDLVRTVVENSNKAFQWTINELGVEYEDRVDQLGGHSVPRSYTARRRSGAMITKRLLAKVKEMGIEVKTRMYLNKILKHADGRVSGVLAGKGYVYPEKDSGAPCYIKAGRAVILATGGFANDLSFRTVQDPRLTSDVDSTNRTCTTAEGLREALGIGAAPVQLSRIQLGPWTSPDEKMSGIGPDFASYVALPYGLLINPASGKRFVNELADRKIRADAILNLGRPCIGIADASKIEKGGAKIEQCLKKGVVQKFDRLEDLAKSYDLPILPLNETIQRFNAFVINGQDEEFGKPILEGAEPLVHPPFYAIRLWPKVHHTMGGVHINTNAQVIDLHHNPINGLYAAGEVTGGVHGACRLGSCAITDCLVFGRIAGQNAAREAS